MAKYNGTFSCGHEGRVDIIGPSKDRDWKIERAFDKRCPDCYSKWLEEEQIRKNNEAIEKAKEMELPELIGSEKQVAWANTLRQQLIENIQNKMVKIEERKGNKELANTIFDFILTTKTAAKWFIDNRFDFSNVEELFRTIKAELPTVEEVVEKKITEEVKVESAISPEEIKHDGIIEILATETKISVKFEKNDDFRTIVKELGYKWDGIWERNINETTGSYIDRAAELGNKLLNAGFTVSIKDEDIKIKAINGNYIQECTRWIYKRLDADCFAINWGKYDNVLYNASRKLPGAHWEGGSMLVKVAHYKEVEDFARIMGFAFTKLALQLKQNYIDKIKTIEKVNPVNVEKEEIKDGLKEILNSGSDILDDLKD